MAAKQAERNIQEIWETFKENERRFKETERVIEVKSTLSVDDVNEHLQSLSEFKFFFPEYADRKVVGAVAGIVIDKGAGGCAYQSGLFVVGHSGETVKILNDEKFVPRTW